MVVSILEKGQIQDACKQLQRADNNFQKWKDGGREKAMKLFPNEFVAVLDGEVILHSKNYNSFVKKLNGMDVDLAVVYYDHLLPIKPAKTKREIAQILSQALDEVERDPTFFAQVALDRKVHAITPEALEKRFTI